MAQWNKVHFCSIRSNRHGTNGALETTVWAEAPRSNVLRLRHWQQDLEAQVQHPTSMVLKGPKVRRLLWTQHPSLWRVSHIFKAHTMASKNSANCSLSKNPYYNLKCYHWKMVGENKTITLDPWKDLLCNAPCFLLWKTICKVPSSLLVPNWRHLIKYS